MKKLILAACLLLPLNAIPQVVEEKLPIYCSSTDAIIEGLREKYRETPVGIGRTEGVIVTIWTNKETKSFTIIATSKDKSTTCVIVAGTNFNAIQLQGNRINYETTERLY